MKKVFLLLSLTFLLFGCAPYKRAFSDPADIRIGMLKMGLFQDAFVDVWGYPDRVSTITGDEAMSADWGRHGGGFFKGKKTYEQWSYEKKGVELVFSNRYLQAWKTDKTVQELKALTKPE